MKNNNSRLMSLRNIGANKLFLAGSIILLCSGSGSAQVSGFMGKKFLLSAAVEANTNEIMLSDYSYSPKSPVSYYLDLKSYYHAGYVVSRRMIVGVDAQLNKLHLPVRGREYVPNGWDFTIRGSADDLDLKIKLIGLNMKLFKQYYSLAPLGGYIEAQAGVISYELIDQAGFTNKKDQALESGSGYYLGFGVGRQQMLVKHLLFNAGVNFKFSTLILGDLSRDPDADGIAYTSQNGNKITLDYMPPAAKVLYSTTFNARIGLGYMLF